MYNKLIESITLTSLLLLANISPVSAQRYEDTRGNRSSELATITDNNQHQAIKSCERIGGNVLILLYGNTYSCQFSQAVQAERNRRYSLENGQLINRNNGTWK